MPIQDAMFRRAFLPKRRDKTCAFGPCRPGVPLYLDSRKDGRSQRWALANNLPADAGAGEKAVHARQNGQARQLRQEPPPQPKMAAFTGV